MRVQGFIIDHQFNRQMQNQQRGMFKPSLKSHSLLNNPTLKRFCFQEPSLGQDFASKLYNLTIDHSNNISYPTLDQKQPEYQSKAWNPNPRYKNLNTNNAYNDMQNTSTVTLTRFDPILPKLLFKRFITDAQPPQPQTKNLNNQIIQQLKLKNFNYPPEVQLMFKDVQDKKILHKQSLSNPNSSSMQNQNQNSTNKLSTHSFKQTLQNYSPKGLQKIPYFPLMGTDGSIFWSFSVDKIILWRYKLQNYSNPEVFCILNFSKETAPISALYATQIQSSIFKHQKTILIAIAFFDQLQFFSFDIQKYERQFIFSSATINKTSQDLQKYVEKIMVKVQAKFLIEKILIQNIQNYSSSNRYLRPLIIFTDGAKDIEIVDLENLAAYKSHNQLDIFSMRERNKANKTQNQIIKLLHCRDDNNPLIHYAFVLKKQITDEMVQPKTFLQKFRNIFSKKYEKKQQIILSIYEWNETELKNDTLYKKVWNPQRVRKIKEITSTDFQIRLKQNFFDFYRLNINNQFIIADVSLVEKHSNLKLFQSSGAEGCNLKVSFTNGTSVLISNFRTLTFSSNVKVHPYIQKAFPVSNCQYHNYRKLLDKGKYLQTQNQVKNKFNLYIYEPIESEKEPKYSRIDPVVSQCDGLTICEGKIIFEDQMQILYDLTDSSTRKRIHKINDRKNSHKKSFMIFENSYITVVETPNIAQNFLVIGYLHKQYPELKEKIKQYANSFFSEFTEQQKINLIECIVELLMQIESSGKGKQSNTESKIVFNELIKEFYGKQNKFVDETTYIEEKDFNPQSSEVYGYSVEVNKAEYQNLVNYFLGADVLAKQKQTLKNMNSSFNGKTFSFKVNQQIFEFLMELLIEHGMKQVSDKHVKTANNVMQISNSLSKYISSSVTNSNDQRYLANLFLGMFEMKESFMISGISKYIMGLIQPVLDISYKDFYRLKSLINIIGQKFDQLNTFLEGFIYHCSFKNNKVQIFEETVLFCKSLSNSLPKISLLLRLFQSLSQVEYCNPLLQNNHKAFWIEVTLKNILFKVGTKDILSRITVENLFEENSMMLDELEEKLPELNDIKYLRFYIGWKKLNSKIIQNTEVKQQKSSNQSNTWFFNFFSNQKPKKALKKSLLFDNQEQKLEQIIAKKKQQFLSIEKALNEYSYEDFDKYFIAKGQYSDFVNILLSKIYYLQINYLELKDKYNFNDEGYQTFNDFMKASQKSQNQPFQGQSNPNQIKKTTKNLVFRSFLNYEQKVCGHQKYFKNYSQIKFFNQKILFFFDKALNLYKAESQKLQKQLISTVPQKQSEWNHTKGYQNQNHSNQYEKMITEIQLMVDLLLSQGSELIKGEVTKTLSGDPLLESFMKRGKHMIWAKLEGSQNETEKVSLFSGIQKDWLVRGTETEWSENRMGLREKQERHKMYDQSINEKISRQFKGGYGNAKDTNWMKRHNYQSEEAFKDEHF